MLFRSAGGACGVGSAESVEGVWEETIREPGTVVGDMDLDIVGVNALDANDDRRGTVLGGVVDEVADHPINVVGVCADVLPCGAIDVELVAETKDGGLLKYGIPCKDTIVEDGHVLPAASLNLTTVINFQPIGGGRAAINCDSLDRKEGAAHRGPRLAGPSGDREARRVGHVMARLDAVLLGRYIQPVVVNCPLRCLLRTNRRRCACAAT